MGKKIFLVGYRGTGKTVIGKKLAEKTCEKFLDTDEIITEISGKTIPKIFEEDGEKKFRKIETEALKKSINRSEKIVSCGGGIITKEENINLLKENGIVFLLKAKPETIYKRIYKDSNRPSLTNKKPFEEIKYMLKKREKQYEKAKDFEVDTNKKSVEECAEEILEKIS